MMDATEKKEPQPVTRRAFLKRASIGLAALATFAAGASKLLFPASKEKPAPPSFAAEDSIFRPRKDQRLDL